MGSPYSAAATARIAADIAIENESKNGACIVSAGTVLNIHKNKFYY